MFKDDYLRSILDNKPENSNIDFKRGFDWKTKSKQTIDVIKDIMAFSNTQDGGTLIIGFDEKENKFSSPSEEWLKSYDQTDVSDSLNKYCDPEIYLNLSKRDNFEWNNQKGHLVILEIKDFNISPTICRLESPLFDNKTIFKPGDVFIRTPGASTKKISTASEMYDLIHRFAIKDKERLLREISLIVNNKPIDFTEEPKKKYETEIDTFEKDIQLKQIISSQDKGYWQIYMMPVKYNSNCIELDKMWDIATQSQSRHRGWPFPFIGERYTENNASCLETFLPPDTHSKEEEGWRLHKDGLFCFRKMMFENVSSDYFNTLSKVSAIWTITEMLLFSKRLYEKILEPNDSIYIELTLMGCQGRRYFDNWMDNKYGQPKDIGNTCNTPKIVLTHETQNLRLVLDWKKIADNFIKELDFNFNVRNYDEKYTEKLQDMILNMHLISEKF